VQTWSGVKRSGIFARCREKAKIPLALHFCTPFPETGGVQTWSGVKRSGIFARCREKAKIPLALHFCTPFPAFFEEIRHEIFQC